MLAGIETGGTKVVCGVVDESAPTTLLMTRRFPTTTPAETIARIVEFVRDAHREHGVDAVGIASFGPVNVDPARPRYGWITGTSKPGWANTKLLERIAQHVSQPLALVSDVSGAALGEQRWGAGRDVGSLAYATFGTGVGIGVVIDGRVLHSNGAPEVGHLLVRRHPSDDFAGSCPFHGDCLEGLAAGPSVLARWGADSSHLPVRVQREAFEMLGYYVAQAVAAISYSTGVERVAVGGGVVKAPGLLDEARRQLTVVTGGPLAGHPIAADPWDFMVPPELGDRSGVLGAVAAAQLLAAPTALA
ncbi:ROK family protein [Rathayibacter sp. VKM Ac-2803]|uniref:ROK family protein n=1 Tax=Rathayibacter sp. VKM Ac-2803 TaxID=2609256 RepID=UPI00135A441D|nr:ROK family protein [Rathayibacter sp. VKM Ac-2803]MWV48552.1 ROK family protein [Rathayibacter sp. VKM Ac-2803]